MEVHLTPAQKHLIVGLKIMGCDMMTSVGISIMLMDSREMLDSMMGWMCGHEHATRDEIVAKALEIYHSVEMNSPEVLEDPFEQDESEDSEKRYTQEEYEALMREEARRDHRDEEKTPEA